MKYRSYRFVDGGAKWVIADENGNIINKSPTKEELKEFETDPHKYGYSKPRPWMRYKEEELMNYLIQFVVENERIPTQEDFINNPKYPSYKTYQNYFGNWQNALKLVGLDTDSLIKKGILDNSTQKGRLFEIIIKDRFENKSEDLSGENYHSSCDGICPKGKYYEVKSSKLYEKGCWIFTIRNKSKEEIEYYYFGAFNDDYTKLIHVWRVPGELVEKDCFIVGLSTGYKFNVENMKEYEITDKFKDFI